MIFSIDGSQYCLQNLSLEIVLKELIKQKALIAEKITIGMANAFLVLNTNSEMLKKIFEEIKQDKPQSMVKEIFYLTVE